MKAPSQASLRKRKEQNKVAQRKFRERRAKIAQEQKEEFERLGAQCRALLAENEALKSHSKTVVSDTIVVEVPTFQPSPEPESLPDIFPLEEIGELSEDLNEYTAELFDLDASDLQNLSFEGMQTVDDTDTPTPNLGMHNSSESPIHLHIDSCGISKQPISRSECSLKDSLSSEKPLLTEEAALDNYMRSTSDSNDWDIESSLLECDKGAIGNDNTQ